MDQFALIFVVAITPLSCVAVDWKYDQRSALAQVRMMAIGLILLYVFLIVRGTRVNNATTVARLTNGPNPLAPGLKVDQRRITWACGPFCALGTTR
jgi:hypothetical protein